jgi:hypothetical protein
MPLKLNVGASRKVTDNNYGSRGATVHLELELDTTLVSDPPKLQEKIRQLFGLVRVSLAEELNGHGNGKTGGASYPATQGAPPAPDRFAGNGNGRHDGPNQIDPRPATASQCKALRSIARSQRIDLTEFLRSCCNAERPEDLLIKQASHAIDQLKAAGAAQGP